MSENGRERHALIAGAGIGGLAVAAALHRRGWRVTVCERAAELPLTGAGIVLAPNALRALDAIGLGDTAWAGEALPAAMGLRRPDGTWLRHADTAAMVARYGRAPLAVHRPALARALAAAVPAGSLRFGTAVTDVDRPDSDRPVVRTTTGVVAADLVVAADGINSALRRRFFPSHPGLRHSGEAAWRTVIPGVGLPELLTAETWGRGERFGIVPLADGQVYVYATALGPEGYRPADHRTELLRRFARWHDPIPELLDRLDPAHVLHHDLHDLAVPLPRFHHGRIAWLGDAAHAMTPNLGQGGCQAIEDAAVLAGLLDGGAAPVPGGEDVPAALTAYTAARHRRTTTIGRRARRAGRLVQQTHPLAAAARDLLVRLTPERAARRALDEMFTGVQFS
ncbi:FAD-dependent monooxygenase [Streptomyces sp. NPDC093225]|uniref:FAD-dependent monooxygenase n=1 Tax=Streptomyces sp. NPDC093225 TaxID=3366034 RepID=UPI00381059AC